MSDNNQAFKEFKKAFDKAFATAKSVAVTPILSDFFICHYCNKPTKGDPGADDICLRCEAELEDAAQQRDEE